MKFMPYLCLFTLVSCGVQVAREAEVTILNGGNMPKSTNDPRYVSTVGITSIDLKGKNWKALGQSYCSGVLITANAVLTAAHCILDDDASVYDLHKEIFMGEKLDPESKTLSVSRAIVHPQLRRELILTENAKQPPNDLAVLILSEPVKAPFRAVAIADGLSVSVSDGDPLLLAGYGVMGPYDVRDTGTLRQAEVPVAGVNFEMQRILLGGRAGACKGDSGGPAFVQRQGRWYLVGILSTGIMAQDGSCMGLNRYTDVRPRETRAWVESVLSRGLLTVKM